METELIPFPGGTMSLGDIERRLRVLEQQFQTLLEKATDDPAAYGGQFKEILDEQTFLKEKRSEILADNNEQGKSKSAHPGCRTDHGKRIALYYRVGRECCPPAGGDSKNPIQG